MKNWKDLKEKLTEVADDNVVKKMLIFEKVKTITKKGKEIERLRPVPVNANVKYVVQFIESFLTNIINHRNLLKNYRTNIENVLLNIDGLIEIWVDFSENLTLQVKQEIQSLHWSKEQVTVHSGITKQDGVKKYHPYISDDRVHDQCFVYNVINEMLEDVTIEAGKSTRVIISDNCTAQ